MPAKAIFLFAIVVLGLLGIISANQSAKEYAKAKKHASWSNIFMYLVISLCVLGFLAVVFNLDTIKFKLKGGELTAHVTNSALDREIDMHNQTGNKNSSEKEFSGKELGGSESEAKWVKEIFKAAKNFIDQINDSTASSKK